MNLNSRSSSVQGFTLVELLLVVLIVILLAGGTVTMFNSIGQARGVTEAASQIASAVELARSQAVARNTYVRLCIMNQTNSGSSDLRVSLFYSIDGTSTTNNSNHLPIAKPSLIQHVMLTNYTALTANLPPSFPTTPTPADLLSAPAVTLIVGNITNKTANDSHTVTFTPLGEATTNPTVASGFDPLIAIGLMQTRGTTPVSNNPVAVVIDGSVGIPTTYQKSP